MWESIKDENACCFTAAGALLDSKVLKVSRIANSFGEGISADGKGNVYTAGSIGYYNRSNPDIIVVKDGKKPRPIVAGLVVESLPGTLQFYPNPVINSLQVVFNANGEAGSYNCVIADINGTTQLQARLIAQDNLYTGRLMYMPCTRVCTCCVLLMV